MDCWVLAMLMIVFAVKVAANSEGGQETQILVFFSHCYGMNRYTMHTFLQFCYVIRLVWRTVASMNV